MKLAVVGMIQSLDPIDGADRILKATVVCGDAGKWCGVVGKGDFSVGDLATVFLQDSLLPENERWAFMEKHKWRVKMSRFRGVPSECLIINGCPMLPPGTDLTDALGVTKFERPIPVQMSGEAIAAFPNFIPKTDEPNFQGVRDWSKLLEVECGWYVTEKADGTSCTAWKCSDGLHVASRNWELREFDEFGGGNIYWQMARKYKLDAMEINCVVQFEIVGPGVQSNPMGLGELEIRVFTGYCNTDGQWLRMDIGQLCRFCDRLDLPMARFISQESGVRTADQLRQMASITYSNGKPAEGIVVRAVDSSWSFKVLNLDYKG